MLSIYLLMINVNTYYEVKRGHESEFESTFTKMLLYLKRNVKGFKDAKLYKEVAAPLQYMVYSEWRDLRSVRTFGSSDYFRSNTHRGKSILKSKPSRGMFKEISKKK